LTAEPCTRIDGAGNNTFAPLDAAIVAAPRSLEWS
jgi:hypothetical protein